MNLGDRALFEIRPARTAADVERARHIFASYAESLPVTLEYQDFDAELASLPGSYTPPKGELLLARSHDREIVGCVALRAMRSDNSAEIKRLYVPPGFRGNGLGKALAVEIMKVARDIGYNEIYLDTLPSMEAAARLYRSLGFEPVDPYYEGAPPGTKFMRFSFNRKSHAD